MIRMGKHEHVVNFLGCSGSKRPPYLVMELAENGNLRDFLRGKKETEQEGYASVEIDNNLGINIQSKINFARQIASGMEFMASINVSQLILIITKVVSNILAISAFIGIWRPEMCW